MEIIEFKDYPSTETPLSAYNLNRMQNNIKEEINTQINEVNSEVSKKIDKTTTIASIDLTDNITEDELAIALKNSIGNLIYPVRKYLYVNKSNKSTKFIWRNVDTDKR